MKLNTFFEKANPDHLATFKWVNVPSSVGESIAYKVQYGAFAGAEGTKLTSSEHLKSTYFSPAREKQAAKKLSREPLPAGGSQGNQKEVF